jgi:hypothetical protein
MCVCAGRDEEVCEDADDTKAHQRSKVGGQQVQEDIYVV